MNENEINKKKILDPNDFDITNNNLVQEQETNDKTLINQTPQPIVESNETFNMPSIQQVGVTTNATENIETQTNTVEMNSTNNIDYNQSNFKKKSPKLLILIGVIFLILGVIIIFYNFYLLNGETIVKKEINNLFLATANAIDVTKNNTLKYDLEKEALGLEGSISLSSDYKNEYIDLTKLKNYSFKYNGVIDKNNNKLSGNISLLKDNNSLLLANGYMYGKDLLLKSEQLFSKVLKTTLDYELKDIKISKSLDNENLKTLINKTKDITLDSINKNNITRTIEKAEINNKEELCVKISYLFNYNDYAKKLIKGYLEDDEVLTILANLENGDKNNLKESLNETLKILEENNDDSQKFVINIYIDKFMGTFKEIEMINEEKLYDDEKIVNKLIISKDENKYNFYEKEDDKLIFSGTYEPTSKTFTIDYKSEYLNLNMVIKQEKENTYQVSINGSQEENSISINITLENKITEDSQTNNVLLALQYKTKDKTINGELKNTTSIIKNKTVTPIETDDVKNYEDLTDEEMNEISTKLMDIYNIIMQDIAPNYNSQDLYSTADYQ